METDWYNVYNTGSVPVRKPRKLTPDEISLILGSLPSVRCTDLDARKVANDSIKDFVKHELTSVYISPDKIHEFTETLVEKFLDARVVFGESAGISTADALGESSTQVALNTFHVGGAATAALVGIEGLKSLIFAYQPKNKSTIIHLNIRPRDFDETLGLRKELEGVSIADLIDMKDIEIDYFKDLEKPYWYKTYQYIYGTFPTDDNIMVMRIPLKVSKLIYFSIDMNELSTYINRVSYGNYKKGIVRVIFSPISEGIIDLHLVPGKALSDNPGLQPFAERSFFRNTVIPVFEYIYIRGIPTIKKVFPVSSAVWEKSFSMVRRPYEDEIDKIQRNFRQSDPRELWYVELDLTSMRKNGIGMDELYGLLDSVGLQHVLENNIMYVRNPFNKKTELSTFIRQMKTGLPFVKGYDIIETKKNRDISRANIKIFPDEEDFYIKYDTKYIKSVLFYMKKRGFEWSLRNSIDLYRLMKYDTDRKGAVEILSTDDNGGDTVKAFKLTKYPKDLNEFYSSDGIIFDNDKLNDYLIYENIIDYDRCFFLSDSLKLFIYFDNKYEKELEFHLNKEGFSWDDDTNFNVNNDVDIILVEQKYTNIVSDSYMKLRPVLHDRIRDLLSKEIDGFKWGDKVNYKVNLEYKTKFSQTDMTGDITMKTLKVPDVITDKVKKRMGNPDEFDREIYIKYINNKFDDLNDEEITDIDELFMSVINNYVKNVTAAKNYDHWFLTTKDKAEKKYNIYDTLSHPIVDSTRTYNNNLNEICAVFGVEAAYTYYIKAMKDLNSASGNYIDPRHILMIADFIFSRGKPNGVLFAGLSRQPLGHISLITVERAMEVLRKLAFTTSTESVNSVSVAISTGQRTPAGTGTMTMSDDPKVQKKILQFTNNTDDISMSADDMSRAVNDLNKGLFNNYEPEKGPAMPPAAKDVGKIYKSLRDLVEDVIKDEEDKDTLGYVDSYTVNILSVPQFNIIGTEAPDKITKLLDESVPELKKRSIAKKERRKPIVINVKKIKDSKGSRTRPKEVIRPKEVSVDRRRVKPINLDSVSEVIKYL